MFNSVAATSITAIASAALVASLAVFCTSAVPQAKAAPQIEAPRDQALAQSDRLPVPAAGTGCSSQGWPQYERKCQFDLRQPANAARTVRIIALR